MIAWFTHHRWRLDEIDAALGLLAADRRVSLDRHRESCPRCPAERERLARILAIADADPARGAAPDVALPHLLARVQAEIDRRQRSTPRPVQPRRALLLPSLVAAGVVVALVFGHRHAPRDRAAAEAAVPAETLGQMEQAAGREQAARYLRDAEDVLVSLAVALPHCGLERREVLTEAARSRELLARRRLLVDTSAAPLAAARPVLEDVDRLLGAVASLDDCAQPADLAFIAERIQTDRLLMKIDLVARELQG